MSCLSFAAGHSIQKDPVRGKSSTTYWLRCAKNHHKCSFCVKLIRPNGGEKWKISLASEPRPCLRHSRGCTSDPYIGTREAADLPGLQASVHAKMALQKGQCSLKQVSDSMAEQGIPIPVGSSNGSQTQNAWRVRNLLGQPHSEQDDMWCKLQDLARVYMERNPGASASPPLPWPPCHSSIFSSCH